MEILAILKLVLVVGVLIVGIHQCCRLWALFKWLEHLDDPDLLEEVNSDV